MEFMRWRWQYSSISSANGCFIVCFALRFQYNDTDAYSCVSDFSTFFIDGVKFYAFLLYVVVAAAAAAMAVCYREQKERNRLLLYIIFYVLFVSARMIVLPKLFKQNEIAFVNDNSHLFAFVQGEVSDFYNLFIYSYKYISHHQRSIANAENTGAFASI